MGRHGASDSKRDAIDAETERFFRAVDRAVLEHHSRPGGLPLLLAALPEHHHLFRKISDNPQLMERSEEHTSELQSLMRISYAVFCLKKKNNTHETTTSLNASCQQPCIIVRKPTESRPPSIHS